MSKRQDEILAVLGDWAPGWASAPTILRLGGKRLSGLSAHGVAMSVTPLVQSGRVERRIGGRGDRRVTQYRITPHRKEN